MDFTIVALLAVFAYGAYRSTYYILKFLTGVAAWGLMAYWISSPISDVTYVNDIIIVLLGGAGLAFFFMPAWFPQKNNGRGGFSVRIPRFLGGQSEEEESETLRINSRTRRDRNGDYADRVRTVMRRR